MSGALSSEPLEAYVNGIGLLGPGLPDWRIGREILAGRSPYVLAKTIIPVPMLLPAAERRRTDRMVKLAIAVGMEAAKAADADVATLQTVFSTSGGDGYNCHEICETLASASPQISPTRFHNSVHNAAAGYWSIATGSMQPSNVLCAFDASFGAGLLETMVEIAAKETPVLFVAFDADYPEPLRSKRPISDAFGVSLMLAPRRRAASLARLSLRLSRSGVAPMDDCFEFLRADIPAARSLPLLQLLSRHEPGRVLIEYLDTQTIVVDVSPCEPCA